MLTEGETSAMQSRGARKWCECAACVGCPSRSADGSCFCHRRSRVISPFYDASGKRGGLLLIDELELAVNAGQPVSDLAHRLRGDATTGGAITLAQQVARANSATGLSGGFLKF